MREVNFSIPNANKASVGITTALYDRRALDCTSTLPLINSLNHLAYLTTSSARIRDILTVDGGIERLVCILKAGRSRDPMNMWKWNLAFQCMVNVGVRGSENVRTRVVEADMVPVIATILDNYIKVIDRCREKAEAAMLAQEQRLQGSKSSEHHESQKASSACSNRAPTSPFRPDSEIRASRRQPPPQFIEIPATFTSANLSSPDTLIATPMTHQPNLPALPERTSFSVNRRRHHHHRGRDLRQHHLPPPRHNIQPLAAVIQSADPSESLNFRPVRDVDRLPSMALGFHNSISPQPDTPITPFPPSSSSLVRPNLRPIPITSSNAHPPRRPSIRHHLSLLGEHGDPNSDSIVSVESTEPEISGGSTVRMQSPVNVDLNIQDISMDESDSMLTADESPLGLTMPTASNPQDAAGNYNTNHQSALTGGLINDNTSPNNPAMGFMPAEPLVANNLPAMSNNSIPQYLLDRPMNRHALAAMPRDEDVLMSLQLLAYVSKYCNLRSYFQKSHLVPKLKIGNELQLLDMADGHLFSPSSSSLPLPSEGQEEEEYLLPDDFNIFPLVEKFTIRHHSQDMQYWAGVVMRNLCRKDESRGGIRQCANYQCGKWEEFTRQFAKCRRCRRTKYCSKECQKSAWIFHRHWCVAANP